MMNLFIKSSLLATALSLAPLSASAFFCGSKNNTYGQGYQNQQPMMMRAVQYNQAPQPYMMMPSAPMPPMQPAPPAFVHYPVMQGNNMYQQPRHAMPMQQVQPHVQMMHSAKPSQPQAQMMHSAKPANSAEPKQAPYGKPMQKQEANNAPKAPATESASAETAKVSINGMQFQPAMLKIKAGESVEWKNMSNMPHSVVSSDGKSLASSQMMNGGAYKHTFKEKGTYTYNCSIHPSMKGQIVVE